MYPFVVTTLSVGLMFTSVALAQEAPPAEPTPAEPAPAEAAPAEATAQPAPDTREEIREIYDVDGRVTRRMLLVGGQLQEEVVNTYDASGRLSARTSTRGAEQRTETWTYDEGGNVLTHETRAGEKVLSSETWTYADGRVATNTLDVDGQKKTTTWTYDGEGRVILVETKAADGSVLSRAVSDRQAPPPPVVPIALELSGGFATDSDVRTTSVTAGFSIERKVPPELYDEDHLEVAAFGTYTRGVSQGAVTNDDLSVGFGLDYNEFVDRTSAFLFMKVERNPVANLDIDLEIAPIGIKYDLVPEGGLFSLDASFAPIWNFRSILVTAGGECDAVVVDVDTHCTFNKVRGSFRARAALEVGPLKVKDVLEFQPTLNPASGDLVAGIREEAIVENTTSLSVKLSQRLALASAISFTRDPLLAEQADCTADPENLLCDGMMLESASTLTLSMSF